jgi:hypothetical protein
MLSAAWICCHVLRASEMRQQDQSTTPCGRCRLNMGQVALVPWQGPHVRLSLHALAQLPPDPSVPAGLQRVRLAAFYTFDVELSHGGCRDEALCQAGMRPGAAETVSWRQGGDAQSAPPLATMRARAMSAGVLMDDLVQVVQWERELLTSCCQHLSCRGLTGRTEAAHAGGGSCCRICHSVLHGCLHVVAVPHGVATESGGKILRQSEPAAEDATGVDDAIKALLPAIST